MSQTSQKIDLTSPIEKAERRERVKSRTELDLWKAIWEASQFMDRAEMTIYMSKVWNEIESDEP